MRIANINEEHRLYVARHARWSESRHLYTAALLPSEPLCGAGCDTDTGFDHQFTENCDLKGTSLREFFKQRMMEASVCGSSYIVIDFAGRNGEEDRAYLVAYWPDEVINWKCGEGGRLEWIVIRTSCPQDSGVRETLWTRYGREHFQISRSAGQDGSIELIEEGRHGLAGLRQVPAFRVSPDRDAVRKVMKRILNTITAARGPEA
jgi:hypothetical protein